MYGHQSDIFHGTIWMSNEIVSNNNHESCMMSAPSWKLSHRAKTICSIDHGQARQAHQTGLRLTKATLKSKASPRSVNPSPKNTCRLLVGSTTLNTKYRELSETDSTATLLCPSGTGHVTYRSPLNHPPGSERGRNNPSLFHKCRPLVQAL